MAERLEQINLAVAEGHDLGSHACGHFDGKDWSTTGRALFNLNPEQAIERFGQELEHVE